MFLERISPGKFAAEKYTKTTPARVSNNFSNLTEYFESWKKVVEYLENLNNVYIATLGPAGTSSEAAASYLLKALKKPSKNYLLFSSYEEACNSLFVGSANLLLVANAYERIDRLYMNMDLKLLLAFIWETPSYGIAKKRGTQLSSSYPLTIATHHAPSSLVPWFIPEKGTNYQLMVTNSTSEAAMRVTKGEVDLCLTNINSVNQYGLEFISRVRTICMLWSIFTLNHNPENDRKLGEH